MAYRTSARDEHDPVLEVKGDSLARVEVSGHAGLSGPNGRSGADGYGAGADGQAGSEPLGHGVAAAIAVIVGDYH